LVDQIQRHITGRQLRALGPEHESAHQAALCARQFQSLRAARLQSRRGSTDCSLGLSLSAFTDPSATQIVIVAINQSTTSVQQSFAFDGVSTANWQSWVTSANSDLAAGDAIADNASVSYTFAAQSITTLQGSITGPGPVIADNGVSTGSSDNSGGCACTLGTARHARCSAPVALWAALIGALVLISRRRVDGRAPRRKSA
jgi:hypothetical protein